MPELPEVETVRRGLAPHVEGARINSVVLNRPDLRFPFPRKFTDRLTGTTIIHAGRRAKYLLLDLDNGETLLSHLGMTGNFHFNDTPPTPGKHDHVVMALEKSDRPVSWLIYSDPRRFGFMDLFDDPAKCRFLNVLGPEPLGNDFNAIGLAARFKGRRTPVKSALLDQRHVAGLGNIYVCEALWRAGIAPTVLAGALVAANGEPSPALEALVGAVRTVLGDAIKAGGSTLRDSRHTDGEAGYFQHRFDVYDREGSHCARPHCTGTVDRIVQSGRSSFFCPVCQV